MTRTNILTNDKLFDRIESIKQKLEVAETILGEKDYLQCAIRIQEIEKLTKFDNFTLDLLDAINQDKDTAITAE